MSKAIATVFLLLVLGGCNSQLVGQGLRPNPPVYTPPVSYQPVTIITPTGTVFCNRTGTLITCY